MHNSLLYRNALIFLLSAVLVVSLFRWLKASPVLGYLIAGTAIGPYALGLIQKSEEAQTLGDFGVVFLLFVIGLKMPMQRFKILRRYVFGLGLIQVILTTTIFLGIAIAAKMEPRSGFIIASGLALSSTAVVLQVLSERGEAASRFGRVSFAILLFQDLAVVLMLMFLSLVGTNDDNILHLLFMAITKASAALIGIVLIGRIVLRPLYRWIASLENQELFVTTTILMVLATGVVTLKAGLSMELGAFLAGLLLAETEYRHQVEADIQPFHGLLLGLFFMAVGMSIDLHLLMSKPFTILGFSLLLIIGKALIIFLLCLLFKMPLGTALRVGFILAGGGEFVFILFSPAIEKGILDPSTAAIVYLVVLVTMSLTPFLATFGRWIDDKVVQEEADATLEAAISEIEDLRNHVVIVGFGRVGRILAKLFAEKMIPFVAIDNDMSKVSEGRSQGYPVFFGDGRRSHVLNTLAANKASAIVISLDSTSGALRACMMVRRNFPNAQVFVRMRNDDYYEKLTKSGVYVVVPENLEPSLKLAGSVLRAVGVPQDETQKIVNDFRQNYKEEIVQGETTPT